MNHFFMKLPAIERFYSWQESAQLMLSDFQVGACTQEVIGVYQFKSIVHKLRSKQPDSKVNTQRSQL